MIGNQRHPFNPSYLSKGNLANLGSIQENIGFLRVFYNGFFDSRLLHIRCSQKGLIHTIHTDEGLIKIQLANLLYCRPANTGIC